MSHRVLAIIPARGGSKGVKRKNIRSLAGKPLVQYTIEAARQATCIDLLVGTTDDDEIAEVVRGLGCRVLDRPPELARDDTPMAPVIQDAIDQLADEGQRFDIVLLLQPTAPFRTAEDIEIAIELLQSSRRSSLVSVYQVDDHHPARMYTIEDDRLIPVMPEPQARLRQALPEVYHRNGAIYAFRTDFFESTQCVISEDSIPYVMPMARSANVDNETDLAFVEFLMTQRAA